MVVLHPVMKGARPVRPRLIRFSQIDRAVVFNDADETTGESRAFGAALNRLPL